MSARPLVEMTVAVAAGAALGWLFPSAGAAVRPLADLFLRAIQMLIAPLVFSTVVVGIVGAGDLRAIGRLGLRSLVCFQLAITGAIVIGLTFATLFGPGVGLATSVEAAPAATLSEIRGVDLLLRLVPTSIVDALARGDILQIVVFATIFGAALATLGTVAEPVTRILTVIAQATFVVARVVTRLAPVGIFGAIAFTVATQGAATLAAYGRLIGVTYGALALLTIVLLVGVTRYARVSIGAFLRAMREPVITAFATTSSAAALPKLLEALDRLGVPGRVAGFVVPAGYSFNLVGTALYVALATVFVAQTAGVQLGLWNQISLVVIVTLTSRGATGIPRAALVVLSVTLTAYGLPIEAVALLLGIDHVVDMARSATNVIGNGLAALAVARWDGERQVTDSGEVGT